MERHHELIKHHCHPIEPTNRWQVYTALSLLAAGVTQMFTFGFLMDFATTSQGQWFAGLLVASTAVGGLGLWLLATAFPTRTHSCVDLVTVATSTAIGIGLCGLSVGLLERGYPMAPGPHASWAALDAGFILLVSGSVATIHRGVRRLSHSDHRLGLLNGAHHRLGRLLAPAAANPSGERR